MNTTVSIKSKDAWTLYNMQALRKCSVLAFSQGAVVGGHLDKLLSLELYH
jgi:hypothetical protein